MRRQPIWFVLQSLHVKAMEQKDLPLPPLLRYYTGWMTNGQMFDLHPSWSTRIIPSQSCHQRLTEGLQLMKKERKKPDFGSGRACYGDEPQGGRYGTLVLTWNCCHLPSRLRPQRFPKICPIHHLLTKTASGLVYRCLQAGSGIPLCNSQGAFIIAVGW